MLWPIFLTLFLLCALVQCYYWLIAFRRLVQWHGNEQDAGRFTEGVSIVVCVKNAALQLGELMPALVAQNYTNYEVVVVDDGPDFEVEKICQKFQNGSVPVVHVLFDAKQKKIDGKKEPLTAGILAAQNAWVLLTDVDCRPGTGWVSAMTSQINKSNSTTFGIVQIVLGYSPFGGKHFSAQLKRWPYLFMQFDNALIGIQYLSAAQRQKPYMGVGRNLLYQKELFIRTDGYESHLDLISGDDDLFIQQVANAANTVICLLKESIVPSQAPESLMAFLQKKMRHMSTGKRYTPQAKFILAGFSLSYVGFYFIGIVLLFSAYKIIVFPLLIVLTVIIMYMTNRFLNKVGISSFSNKWFALPLIYAVYHIVVALFLVLPAPRKWK